MEEWSLLLPAGRGEIHKWGTVSYVGDSVSLVPDLLHHPHSQVGTVSDIYVPHHHQQQQHQHPKTLIMERYSCGTETLTVDTLVRMTP